MDQPSGSAHRGLTNKQALEQLYRDIQQELADFQFRQKCEVTQRTLNTWLWDAFYHDSTHSLFRWTNALMLFLTGVFFTLTIAFGDQRQLHLILDTAIVFILLVFNVVLSGWSSKQRHEEIQYCTVHVLNYLRDCIDSCEWSPEHFPHLNMPTSPCITLQWTQRNGNVVNLQWSLLVRGDIVHLRAGQPAPGRCHSVDHVGESIELHCGDIYTPCNSQAEKEVPGAPKIRTLLKPGKFLLLETPYLKVLRLALQKSNERPFSKFDKERHIVAYHIIEKIVIPVVFILMATANVLRYVFLRSSVGHWTEMLFQLQAQAILPLIPVLFPVAWVVTNMYGLARITSAYSQRQQVRRTVEAETFEEVTELHPLLPESNLNWRDIRPDLCNMLLGRGQFICRTTSLLHILGSVTELCCVDKKGILSWPNPTAEKVFFLRNCQPSSGTDISCQSPQSLLSEIERPEPEGNSLRSSLKDLGVTSETVVEVLSLTHNNQEQFGSKFDDPTFEKHLTSLKPLGLAILLNTCNPSTQDYYSQFFTHMTYEALHRDELVGSRKGRCPSTDLEAYHFNRCICILPDQMGFIDAAADAFQLQQQISTYKNAQHDQTKKGKADKSSLSKTKFPFPHMFSVIVRETKTGTLQQMCQGTGDLILDSCSDVWDGTDVRPLSKTDRKKILDFYQRTSLSSYCIAFSYRPILFPPNNRGSQICLELPSDITRFYSPCNSPVDRRHFEFGSIDSKNKKVLPHHLSTDSLLNYQLQDDFPTVAADAYFETQRDQIFIGMVTIQYHARTDIVNLVEKLEKANIRFVHFSKENELRSRVFSEKMGLESGWNCHISLLSERARSESGNSLHPSATRTSIKSSACNIAQRRTSMEEAPFTAEGVRTGMEGSKQRSHSAPSAINLDMVTVKFESEISMYDFSALEPNHIGPPVDEPHMLTDNTNPQDQEGAVNSLEPLDVSDEEDNLQQGLLRNSQESVDYSRVSRSPSHVTESTDQSAPVGFDMSNRAKLPKGIENIRPHLDKTDNIPLQVSLFTDCTPETTTEMLKIMQEYGEVVCCLGSAASFANMPMFLQADASISVEPLYPQLCRNQPCFQWTTPSEGPSPVEVTHHLNSIACSLSYDRRDQVNIFNLIMEARHYMLTVKNSFQFYLCCCLALTMLQLASCLLFFPPLLTSTHILWLCCVIIPILSISLINTTCDPAVQTMATGKNNCLVDRKLVSFFSWTTTAKFLPSILIILVCVGMTLMNFCQENKNADEQCLLYLGNMNYSKSGEWNGLGDEYWPVLNLCQNMTAFLLVVYFVLISVSYVHRYVEIWKNNPLNNRHWIYTCIAVITAQSVYFVVSLLAAPFVPGVPLKTWVLAILWPFCLVPMLELIKFRDIRASIRFNKRGRLAFGTKLGMNSPF